MSVNQNGFQVGDAEFVVGLDIEGLKQLSVKDLAAKYCRLDSLIDGDSLGRSYAEKNQIMQIYEQEFFRRVLAGEVHPDDFENYCEEWYREHQNDGENKTGCLNSENGYI